MASTPERRAEIRRATERARAVVRPGDRISRALCGGGRGTFTFLGWDGDWLCGRTVDDCAAVNVVKINGRAVDFSDAGASPSWPPLLSPSPAPAPPDLSLPAPFQN